MRNWYDPWELTFEIIFYLSGAIVCLVTDTICHFMGVLHRDGITLDFKERLKMAYTTVPDYLKGVKHGREVRK